MEPGDHALPPRAVPAMLQRMNVRQVLEAMRELGPCTRTELRRRTGISAPTISKLVAHLLAAGLVQADAGALRTAGRPSKVYRLAGASRQVLAAVLELDRCTVLAAGLDGRPDPASVRRFASPAGYEPFLDALAAALTALRGESPCLGVGLSVPGLINRRQGEVVFSPNLHFLDGRRLGQDLGERLGLETLLLQEEQALCLAEQTHGDARGMADFAMIDISSGLGMGVVSGGQFVAGHSGYGGELGHIVVEPGGLLCGCGNRGCLETVATDTALRRDLAARIGRTLDMDELVRLARAGEIDASRECERLLGYLATGIGTVINIFNPECVFVHGRVFDLADDLFARLCRAVPARALRPAVAECRLVRARGTKSQGAIAAVVGHHIAALGPRLDQG